MDLVSLIGTLLAFVVIALGTVLKGSSLESLWNPAAFLIVFVGTLAALMVQTPAQVLRRATALLPLVYKPPRHFPLNLIKQIIGWSEISRRQGLLGLEPQLDAIKDSFTRKGLQLLIDGGEPEAIRGVLEVELGEGEMLVNVPRNCAEDGHEVLNVEPLGDGRHLLTVRKRGLIR